MRRLVLISLALLVPLLAAFHLDERYSDAHRYLRTHERPHQAASCRGRLGMLDTHTPAWQADLLVVGFIPEHDGPAFKATMQERLANAGFETIRRSRDNHAEDWFVHVRHRLRGEERLLYVRHDRSALRASLWCYLSLTFTSDPPALESPLDGCVAPGRRQAQPCP